MVQLVAIARCAVLVARRGQGTALDPAACFALVQHCLPGTGQEGGGHAAWVRGSMAALLVPFLRRVAVLRCLLLNTEPPLPSATWPDKLDQECRAEVRARRLNGKPWLTHLTLLHPRWQPRFLFHPMAMATARNSMFLPVPRS